MAGWWRDICDPMDHVCLSLILNERDAHGHPLKRLSSPFLRTGFEPVAPPLIIRELTATLSGIDSQKFREDFETGRVVCFPIGWDLDYFSRDQRSAVFGKARGEAFQKRPLQAVTMKTGEYLDALPSRNEKGYVPFSWADTQAVKPFYTHCPKMGDRDFFNGVSVNGRVRSISLDLDETFYCSQAMEADGFVGFRLRRKGGSGNESSPLWLVKDEDPKKPERAAPIVTDFTVLKSGNCEFTTTGYGDRKACREPFFRAFDAKSLWRVLDDVKRLPPRDPEFTKKDYIQDEMSVRLVTGFGSGMPIALCLFQHSREDMRTRAFPTEGKTVKKEFWRRAVILTPGGKRCMTRLFREGRLSDVIWLHLSGMLFTGVNEPIDLPPTNWHPGC